MDNPQVELAQAEDIPQIMALGYQSFKENRIEDFKVKIDFDTSLTILSKGILDETCWVLRNSDSGNIDGFLLTSLTTPWFSNDTYLQNLIVFVKEPCRTLAAIKHLMGKGKEYVTIHRIPFVIDLFAQKDVKKKGKLFKFLGFKECGSMFIFTPP